jgi:hypothetical protein
LNDVFDNSPRGDAKIVLGDFIAKTGSDNAGLIKAKR